MTFNIENQNAGVVNNVAGDQRIEGGQYGILATPAAALEALQRLRGGMSSASLDEGGQFEARAHIDELENELHAPQPDRSRIASVLERLTRLFVATGSLVAAGAALVEPLHTLATWLGALGQPILTLLPIVA